MQFGYNCDYVGVLPLDRRSALLVVNHEYTNEELMFPAGAYDSATTKRIAMASHGLSVLQIQRQGNDGAWKRSQPARLVVQPAGHRDHPVHRRRPGGRGRPAAHHRGPERPDRAGHPQQLLRRHHPVGHGAVGRGELQPVLRQVRRAGLALHRVVRPLRHHRHRLARLERGRPALRPDPRAARAVPVRLDHRDRPARPDEHPAQAHDAGPLQARGRQHPDRRQRARGGLPRRRRARRLPLQVRLGRPLRPARLAGRAQAEPAAAHPRHAVRRPAHRRRCRRRAVRRHRRVDPADQRHHVVRRGDERRGRPHRHPAGGGQGHADPDGPARGRPAEPGQRPDLRGAHQQLQPRARRSRWTSRTRSGRARCGPRSVRR